MIQLQVGQTSTDEQLDEETGLVALWRFDCLLASTKAQNRFLFESLDSSS
jgi:hypothetical protein